MYRTNASPAERKKSHAQSRHQVNNTWLVRITNSLIHEYNIITVYRLF